MVHRKHLPKIILAVIAVAVLLCFAAIAYSEELTKLLGGTGVRMEYETKLFNTDEIIEIDIRMDEDTIQQMLNNAMTEEYYVCDVVVNGTRINNVAIRPKGNTSLSAIAMDPDSDRYSFKLEFDQYVKGQTCFGLDKLILNNNYADATNMKEAVIYDMYQYIGANASLYNYAKVSFNGEYWGVYLALEAVEESFMLRNFGTRDGELYKPDTMEMGGSSKSSTTTGNSSSSSKESADGANTRSERKARGRGGSFQGGGGANLNYTDDSLDSYQTIWDSALTGTSNSDRKRVVEALKNISEGTDLEKYLDVDNVLRYMAVHTFAVNMDSLSGSMSHNYYLYEYDGQLNIFPWDYNLSFGGMSMGSSGSATDMVNDAIDTPFNGTKFFDALLANEEYLAKYHEYLKQLTDEYVNGGRFEQVYNRIRSQIDSLVETDPTAFYTYEEYKTAAELLKETVTLRAESIRGQIDGTIPSTDTAQRGNTSSFVDASHIDVKLMGQFSMGGGNFGGGNMPEGMDFSNMPDGFDPGSLPDGFDSGSFPGGFNSGDGQGGQGGFSFPGGDMPDGFDPGNIPDGFDPGGSGDSQGGRGGQGSFSFPGGSGKGSRGETDSEGKGSTSKDGKDKKGSTSEDGTNASSQKTRPDGESGSKWSMPASFSGQGAPGGQSSRNGGMSASTMNLLIYGGCLVVLLAAMLFVGLAKRRKYRKM